MNFITMTQPSKKRVAAAPLQTKAASVLRKTVN